MNIEIKDKLYKDIESYCALNELNLNDYVNDLLKKSFMIDKYGERPFNGPVPYEPPLPSNENTIKPTEVEIEIKKNEETKEYVVETKETTIPIETGDKPADKIVKQAIESVQEEESVKEEKPKRRKLK